MRLSLKARFAFLDVHTLDQPIHDGMDVQDLLIGEDTAIQILDELVYLDVGFAPLTVNDFNWFHMGIKLSPLTRPVSTDLSLADHSTAFRCLGPIDFLTHQRERAVNVSPIKGGVNLR